MGDLHVIKINSLLLRLMGSLPGENPINQYEFNLYRIILTHGFSNFQNIFVILERFFSHPTII
jgi:hypothetical protein